MVLVPHLNRSGAQGNAVSSENCWPSALVDWYERKDRELGRGKFIDGKYIKIDIKGEINVTQFTNIEK